MYIKCSFSLTLLIILIKTSLFNPGELLGDSCISPQVADPYRTGKTKGNVVQIPFIEIKEITTQDLEREELAKMERRFENRLPSLSVEDHLPAFVHKINVTLYPYWFYCFCCLSDISCITAKVVNDNAAIIDKGITFSFCPISIAVSNSVTNVIPIAK